MVVTVTWIDPEFIMRDVIIGFRELESEHSVINICKILIEVLHEFDIENRV